jgi:hypothetical protein
MCVADFIGDELQQRFGSAVTPELFASFDASIDLFHGGFPVRGSDWESQLTVYKVIHSRLLVLKRGPRFGHEHAGTGVPICLLPTMKMIRQDGKSQQVDPECPGQSLSLIFNQDFAMIVILATHGIVTQQITTATNHTIHHMDNRNFFRRKHFRSCHPRHHSALNQNKSKPLILPISAKSQRNLKPAQCPHDPASPRSDIAVGA